MRGNRQQTISSAELSSFCGQVALILEAGLPLYDGMETLAGADSKSANAAMFKAASEGVTRTGSLYDALKEDDKWPDYLVEMVGIGEKAGQLEKVMRGLEEYYAREDRIRSSLISALTYPLSLGVMLLVIILIMLWQVLPVFRRVLGSMGIGLGSAGNMMMRVGTIVGWLVLILVGLALAALAVGVLLMKTSRRETVLNVVSRLIPRIRRLRKKLSAYRVASVLSLMLYGGFTTDEALEMTASVLDDPQAGARVMQIRNEMHEGKSYADAIENTDLFEDLEVRMIRMGVATGREDQVLGKVAALYEEQTEAEISSLVAIVEPTLVALLSIVVGAVLLSVMLPMAGILSSL